jgi:hypothetical protein
MVTAVTFVTMVALVTNVTELTHAARRGKPYMRSFHTSCKIRTKSKGPKVEVCSGPGRVC